ncbi:MAG: class I SAM-dependent methyltransferase [Candidatus Jordarchaeaceae archaeon]
MNEESLDIGCGGSIQYPIGVSRSRGFINVDIQKPVTKIQNFVQADAHHLPFKNGSFQKVLMYDIIEHVDSPSKCIKEAHRVLKEKGVLELGTPNALYLPKIVRAALRGKYIPYPDHLMTWGAPELENLLIHCGFSKVKIEHRTYINTSNWYNLITKFCPFQSLRHRQLIAIAIKNNITL